MKGFALNERGDVLIENGVVQMVHGDDLTKQTIKTVLDTQKGEWFLNWDEGINHNEILGKRSVEDDVIKAEMQDGVSQVDENLVVSDLETDFDSRTRKLQIHFTAANRETAENIEINQELR